MTDLRSPWILPAFGFVALLLTVPLAGQDLPTAKPEEVGVSSAKVEELSKFMQSLVDDGKIAGGVTMMARHGKVVHLKAVGMADREEKKPMQTDAIFRIASMTKPVTSVAIMMLWEQGKLSLDDPVSKYIPEFKNTKVLVNVDPLETRPPKREITIRHLLTHTSGLTYGSSVKAIYDKHGISGGLSTSEVNLERAQPVCDAARYLYRERFLAEKYGPGVIEATVKPAEDIDPRYPEEAESIPSEGQAWSAS